MKGRLLSLFLQHVHKLGDTATGWTAVVRFPAGKRDFSHLYSIQSDSGVNPASYPMCMGAPSPE
jgi:hypothetical protein